MKFYVSRDIKGKLKYFFDEPKLQNNGRFRGRLMMSDIPGDFFPDLKPQEYIEIPCGK